MNIFYICIYSKLNPAISQIHTFLYEWKKINQRFMETVINCNSKEDFYLFVKEFKWSVSGSALKIKKWFKKQKTRKDIGFF